jgi:hypothetical protein
MYYTLLQQKVERISLMKVLTYLLTYLLTPWCRILFEKLIATQLVKKILLSLRNSKVHHRVQKACHLTLS